MIALLLSGSAIALNSCLEQAPPEPIDEENIISGRADSMMLVSSENGRRTSLFIAPLTERYEFASVPFEEYRKGIDFSTYNDTTGLVSSHIVADYALHWIDRDLWELKGNVVVIGENDRRLFTQQLNWDRKKEKIYSNVDSRIEEGDKVNIVEGFESDIGFTRMTIRKLKGRFPIEVNSSGSGGSGSGTSGNTSTAAPVTTAAPAAPDASAARDADAVVKPQPAAPDASAARDADAVVKPQPAAHPDIMQSRPHPEPDKLEAIPVF